MSKEVGARGRFDIFLDSGLDRRANNTLLLISEVYHCNYIIKYDIKFQKNYYFL